MHGKKKTISVCKFIDFKDNNLIYKCKECNDKSHKPINGLKEKFPNTCKFRYDDLNKFILLLRKGVYRYEYMDSWKKFNETLPPNKETFYSELNKEDAHAHAQNVWEVFKIKNLCEYHDLYVQSDTLLLSDVFENLRDKCIDIYKLDPAHFLSAPGLAWQGRLKKTGVKLELLTDNDVINGINVINAQSKNKCILNE